MASLRGLCTAAAVTAVFINVTAVTRHKYIHTAAPQSSRRQSDQRTVPCRFNRVNKWIKEYGKQSQCR